MADPVTMGVVAIGSTIAGGGLQLLGNQQSSQAAIQQANYRAQVAQFNTTIAKQNASWATEQGGAEAVISGNKTAQQIGTTKTVQAASSLDVNSGSHEAVRDTQLEVGQYDQNTIRANAARKAYGYEVEAAKDTAEGQMQTNAASNIAAAEPIQMASTVLGTVSSVAGKWYQGSTTGIFGGKGSGSIGYYDPSNYGAAPSWT